MNFRFCIILAIFFTSVLAATVSRPHEDCVLNEGGKQECHPSTAIRSMILQVTSRKARRTRAPCSRKDVMCWCKMAIVYTNDVRKKNNRGMLKLGPQKQMDNAMRYAGKLSGMGFLKHQNLQTVTREVGCQRWIGGENLAFNYERGNIARACVNQWIKSKGHFRNLIRTWFEEVVIGFHFDRDGRIYCVQTFGLFIPRQTFGRRNGARCGLARES